MKLTIHKPRRKGTMHDWHIQDAISRNAISDKQFKGVKI